MHGRYCHSCGQDVFAGARRSVWKIVFNVFDNVFSLDNKLLVTLVNLVFCPGKLTKEYFEGHVVKYVVPPKLFWFISILFFAVLTSQVDFGNNKKDISPDEVNIMMTGEQIKDDVKSEDNISNSAEGEKDEKSKKEELKIKMVKSVVSTYFPYLVFIMIPFFALFVMLFFHRRRDGFIYADHLVFAFHFHSFVFLFFGICILLSKVFPQVPTEIDTFVFFTPPLYLLIAVYVFYRPRIISLVWKFPIMSFCYFVSLLVVVISMLVIFASLLEAGYFPDIKELVTSM